MYQLKSQYFIALIMSTYLALFCSTICQANSIDYRYSKAFPIQKLSIEGGLSQSVVNDIIQDQQGYIWLATEDGLNRFDSYEFEIFQHDEQDEYSLHENLILSLLEEPGKGIWVGTAVGLSFFDFEDRTFTNLSELGSNPKLWISSLMMDSSGRIWASSENGLYYMDQDRREMKQFITRSGDRLAEYITSVADSEEFLYITGKKCLRRVNKKNFETINLCDQQSLQGLKGAMLSKVLKKGNILWIGSDRGLVKYDIENDSSVHFTYLADDVNSLSDDVVQDFLFDDSGIFWIATTDGVNAYNPDKQTFTRYQRKAYSDDGLSANEVLSLYIGKDGLVWLGTHTGGFNILDPQQGRFEHLLTNSDVSNLGKNNTILGIEKDSNDNLWLASNGAGLLKYNLLSAELTRPLHDLGVSHGKYTYSLFADHRKRLWILELNNIKLWDLDNDKIINVQFNVDGVIVENLQSVNQAAEDSSGIIWLAMEKGLMRVTKYEWIGNVLHVSLIDLTDKLPQSFLTLSSVVARVMQDGNGDYWFGGAAGLVYYQVKANKWRHFQYAKGNHQSISNNNVQSIFEDSRGFIWIGTVDGLNRVVRSTIDEDSIYFDRITKHDGLPNNSIYAILEDDENQLWISTNVGLVKYAKDRHDMEIYHVEDGISSDEFNAAASFTDSDGRLYFGSINGVTVVKSQSFQKRTTDTLLYFSQVLVDDREMDTRLLNLSENPGITQRADETSVSVKVVNVNYTKLGSQRYRYRILGLSNTWRYLGMERTVSIAGLPEGSFRLEIQSRLAGEIWGPGAKLLNIRVETSFWNSDQAYYLIALITLFLFMLSIYYISLIYRRKIDFISKKMNIEALRARETKTDNESLMKALSNRDATVSLLQEEIDSSNRKLESEQYRDAITGFYRLNYLYSLNDQFTERVTASDDPEMFDRYRATAIFELRDYSRLCREYGILASAEFLSKASTVIRQQMMSECQIFFIDNGMLLLVSGGQEYTEFENDLVNLANLVTRSEFEFANGLSSNTQVLITSIDLKELSLRYPDNIGSIVPKQIQLHSQLEDNYRKLNISKFYYQISIMNSIDFLRYPNNEINLNDMIAKGILSLEPL